MAIFKLLGISGSVRRDSYNTSILKTLASRVAGTDVQLDLFALNNVPIYNEDLDGARAPAAVLALRAAVEGADGFVICSPEYNYGMPGVLKNALDWVYKIAA